MDAVLGRQRLYAILFLACACALLGLSAVLTVAFFPAKENKPPEATFYSPLEVPTGEPATLDATRSRDPDGSAMTFAWDLGDGNRSVGAVTEHAYERPGAYTIVLTVTDNGGRSATASREIRVTEVDQYRKTSVADILALSPLDAIGMRVHAKAVADGTFTGGSLRLVFIADNPGGETVTVAGFAGSSMDAVAQGDWVEVWGVLSVYEGKLEIVVRAGTPDRLERVQGGA